MSLQDFAAEARGGGGRTLVGATLGSALGVNTIPFFIVGVLVAPLQAEFGWGRGEIQASLAWAMAGMVAGAMPTGWMADRIGARRTAIIGLVIHALALVGLAMAGPSLIAWHLSWFLMAFFASGSTALTFTRGVSDWFEKGRGLALGITLTGNGVTGVIAPPLATAIMVAHGWREALLVLAGVVIVVGLLPVLLLFRERPQARQAEHVPLVGLSMRQAVRGYRLWLLVIAFLFLSFGVAGAIPSLVPLFLDRGFTPLEAASMASLIGFSIIVGRIGSGFLFDRFWAPGVAAVLLMLPLAGALILSSAASGTVLLAMAVISIGLVAGMEFDLMGYLVGRYFGLRNYGKLFAAPWIGMAAGAGIGATVFGQVRDVTGSYTPVLVLAACTFAAAAVLMLALGRYPAREKLTAISDNAPPPEGAEAITP